MNIKDADLPVLGLDFDVYQAFKKGDLQVLLVRDQETAKHFFEVLDTSDFYVSRNDQFENIIGHAYCSEFMTATAESLYEDFADALGDREQFFKMFDKDQELTLFMLNAFDDLD